MVTVPGATETFNGSALTRVTTRPPCGAGPLNVTGNAADCPTATDKVDSTDNEPGVSTVTGRVAPVTFGAVVLAVIVAVPTATPVMLNVTLFVLASIVTLAGTVADAGVLELRATFRPPVGAGAERSNVTARIPPAPTVAA